MQIVQIMQILRQKRFNTEGVSFQKQATLNHEPNNCQRYFSSLQLIYVCKCSNKIPLAGAIHSLG